MLNFRLMNLNKSLINLNHYNQSPSKIIQIAMNQSISNLKRKKNFEESLISSRSDKDKLLMKRPIDRNFYHQSSPSHLNLNPLKQNQSSSRIDSNPSSFKKRIDSSDKEKKEKFENRSRGKEEEQEEELNRPVGLFGKVRQLSKLYGSAALIIYGVLSACDFGLSFLMIYLIGAEHVTQAEDWVIDKLRLKRINHKNDEELENSTNSITGKGDGSVGVGGEVIDNNMIWTTAILAYTIHKTVLLPVRVGLTAWITPPIVRALRRRGWKIGKQKV